MRMLKANVAPLLARASEGGFGSRAEDQQCSDFRPFHPESCRTCCAAKIFSLVPRADVASVDKVDRVVQWSMKDTHGRWLTATAVWTLFCIWRFCHAGQSVTQARGDPGC